MISTDIGEWASLPRTPLSIDHMLKTGSQLNEKSLLLSSLFLKNELAIRLARTLVEFEALPPKLLSNKPIQRLLELHKESFSEITSFSSLLPSSIISQANEVIRDSGKFLQGTLPPAHSWAADLSDIAHTPEEMRVLVDQESKFVEVLTRIKARHRADPVFLSLGLHQFRGSVPSFIAQEATQDLLDSFNRGRIGQRLLIGQHVALATAFRSGELSNKRIGIIDTQTDVVAVIEEAWERAKLVAMRQYQCVMPELEFRTPKNNPRPHFVYIPTILHHIVYELLKNSIRATIETRGLNAKPYPSIRIVISSGKEDMIIKIADLGGGVGRSEFDNLQGYMQRGTGTEAIEFGYDQAVGLLESLDTASPRDNFTYGLGVTSSLGVGIPLSRLYAEYLGGSLEILSMEGFGTDAFIHLNKISNVVEQLGMANPFEARSL
jgi:pyruvate dehydrogenase kinase 2/3/4